MCVCVCVCGGGGGGGGGGYWNVAYTTFIIFYVETKIYSNFEVSILYTGLIYHRDCPERICFPLGDPYIQTSYSRSLRGRLEYTPLGLDGYWSMDSNGELFKWWIAPYSWSTFFWKHINNISMYSLTCCAKWNCKYMSYITKQDIFHCNSCTAHDPDGSHVG